MIVLLFALLTAGSVATASNAHSEWLIEYAKLVDVQAANEKGQDTVDAFLASPWNPVLGEAARGILERRRRAALVAQIPAHDLGNAGGSSQTTTTEVAPKSIPLETAILTGLADFMVERAKMEATITFLENIRKVMDKTTKNKLARLFPHTYRLLNLGADSDKGDITYLFPLGTTFKVALNNDLQNLPRVIAGQLADRKDKALALAAVRLFDDLRSGIPPDRALERAWSEIGTSTNADAGMRTLGLVVRYWRLTATVLNVQIPARGTVQYVAQDSLRELILNPYAMREHRALVFLLLYEIGADRDFYQYLYGAEVDPSSDPVLAGAVGDKIWSRLESLYYLISKISRLQGDIAHADETRGDSKPSDLSIVASYFRAVASVMDELNGMFPDGSAQENVTSLAFWVQTSGDFFGAIESRDYGTAVAVGLKFYKEKFTDPHAPGEYKDEEEKWFYRLLSLAATLSAVETSEDAKKAIETAAMPVGGYRVKQKHGFMGLNGYFAFSIGPECVDGVKKCDIWQAAAWVPIGIERSGSLGKGLYAGVFVSIIDIGALTSYRLKSSGEGDTEIDKQPEIGFKQVFSPGVFGTLGLGKAFSAGLGVELTPELRTIKDNTDDSEQRRRTVRFAVFAGFDIPLFQLR